MKGEEEVFPKGSIWYCDQCKLVDGLEVSVWVDPNEPGWLRRLVPQL